jgi:serine protease Do
MWRDGKEISADVKIAPLNTDKLASVPAAAETPRKDTPTVDAAGMSLAKITPEVRKELELADDAKGVIVFDIDEDGPAAKQGVQTGDIVASVGRDPVTTPEQIVDKIEQARKAGRKSVLLRIERDGAAQFVAVPLDTKPNGG